MFRLGDGDAPFGTLGWMTSPDLRATLGDAGAVINVECISGWGKRLRSTFVAARQLDTGMAAATTSNAMSSAVTALGVGVLIATYNRSAYLREALQSIQAQTQPPAQIVVIDDGSTDDTREVVERFGSAVEYRRKVNGGKASALNLGLSRIVQPLIWIFDDDDVAAPGALETMRRALADRPDAGFVYGRYDIFEDHPVAGRRTLDAGAPDVAPEDVFAALLERCFVLQGGMLVRRRCYDALGGFDETLVRSQDYEMLLRLARRFQAVRVDDLLFHQRKHAGVRGTAAAPVPSARMDDAWRSYDKRILGGLRGQLALADYLPGSQATTADAPLTGAERRLALAHRFVIFARKDIWPDATLDFQAFVSEVSASRPARLTSAEIAVLERTFDVYSRALVDFAAQSDFRTVLRSIRDPRLKAQIEASFLASLAYPLRAASMSRSWWTMRRLAQAFLTFGGLRSLPLFFSRLVRNKISRARQRSKACS